MKERMRAIVFEGKHKFGLKDVPAPQPGEKEVLIKVDTCGVCGTDIHIYEGTFPADFPVIIGHEFTGRVEEIGKGVKNFGVGDPVTVDPNTTCEQCEWCRKGQKHLCPDLVNLGLKVNGGFAEYARVKEAYVYHLPQDLDLESASFAEPLSCCLHGVDLAQIKSGDALVILGAGPIGLLMLQLAKISGAGKVVSVDPMGKRRNLAIQLGVDLALDPTTTNIVNSVEEFFDGKADRVIECVGSSHTQEDSLFLVKPGGRVVWFGVANPKAEVRINPFNIYRNEITVLGSFVNPYTTERSIKLLSSGRIKVKNLITHRFRLDQLDEAIKTYLNDENRVKIVMKPWKR